MTLSAEDRARRSAEVMWASDRASPWFGMELGPVSEGRAVVTLTVERHHVNGVDICHGGVIFSLADSAFAFACNSRNVMTVAYHDDITFLRPARLGETLTAEAREIGLEGRNGTTDVEVRNDRGEIVARFRGLSRSLGKPLFDEDDQR